MVGPLAVVYYPPLATGDEGVFELPVRVAFEVKP
jgi:hypothetical protein